MVGVSGFMQAPKETVASSERDTDPYLQGYLAFQTQAKNPFQIGSANRRVWEHGNLTAQAESDF